MQLRIGLKRQTNRQDRMDIHAMLDSGGFQEHSGQRKRPVHAGQQKMPLLCVNDNIVRLLQN